MKFMTGTVAVVAIAVSSMSAQAVTTNPTGPYVGAGVGQFNLKLNHLDDVDDAVGTIADSDDNAWKVFGGYRFNPYLGVELSYIDFGRPNDRFSANGTDGNYRVSMSGFSPALVGRFPLGPVELFGKVGQYYYDVKTRIDLDAPGPSISSKHSRNDFIWGGGVSVAVLDHVELRGEYERIEIENARDSNAFWLGAAWRF